MVVSQNGYKANDSSLIASYTIVRDVKINLRKGDASVVLLHWARWFDANIQPLTKADTGGYNPRVISGSSILSNHASGTAEDLRWNLHPRGKKDTFTASQKAKIEAQLKFYEGAIRWGGDYVTATIDEMHFEINVGASKLATIAQKCKDHPVGSTSGAPAPKPPTVPKTTPVDGKLGPKTISLWQKVMGTPVDGKIDAKNSALIKKVQQKLNKALNAKLTVDGDLGPKTIKALQHYLKSPIDGHITTPVSLVVKALQRRLNTGTF